MVDLCDNLMAWAKPGIQNIRGMEQGETAAISCNEGQFCCIL